MATIRRTCTCRWCISSFGMNISEVKRHRTTFEDGSSEIAVSSVDFLVSNTDSFVMGCNKYYASKCIGGNINKGGLWDTVLSELERTCISKVERLPKYGSQMETVYTVPIVGHMQFPPSATDEDNILGSYHESREESAPCAFHGMKRAAVQKVKRNPAKVQYTDIDYILYLLYVLYKAISNLSYYYNLCCISSSIYSGKESISTLRWCMNTMPRAPTACAPWVHYNPHYPHSVAVARLRWWSLSKACLTEIAKALAVIVHA